MPEFDPSERSERPAVGVWGSVLLGMLAALILAGWLPHYLTWPWWADLDAYATIAQGWDSGILPYRDVTIFNFPGQIELAWLLGHAFGWGRTWPIYAVDAAITLGLCGLSLWWSRRRFGSMLPGWIGAVAILHLAANQDYSQAVQRDWQGPLLAASGLLILQARPGRSARVASGLLSGCAGAIRPHAILFAPAQIVAIVVEGRARRKPPGRIVREVVEWAVSASVALAMAFAPLAIGGLLGDFVTGVSKAGYGSSYNQTSPMSFWASIWRQVGAGSGDPRDRFRDAGLAAVAIAVAGLAALVRKQRGTAIPWLCALIGAYLYAPLHPKPHAYLALPHLLFGCLALSVVAGAARDLRRVWFFGYCLVLLPIALPGVPESWDLSASLDAIDPSGPAGRKAEVPPGARGYFAPADSRSPYNWGDYQDLLRYLRARTAPDAMVVNLLRNVPFPAIKRPGRAGLAVPRRVGPDLALVGRAGSRARLRRGDRPRPRRHRRRLGPRPPDLHRSPRPPQCRAPRPRIVPPRSHLRRVPGLAETARGYD